MIQHIKIEKEAKGYSLEMAWKNRIGTTIQHQEFNTDPQILKYRAIIESRQHIQLEMGSFLDEIGVRTKLLTANELKVYNALVKIYLEIDQGTDTHFEICRRIQDNTRFFIRVIPNVGTMRFELLERWRFIESIINDELTHLDSKKWIYE